VPGRRYRRREIELERALGAPALFVTAYGNVGSSIYYALGLTAFYALGLAPLIFVVAGIVFAATAATYAEGTARFPEAGGSASFARHSFDELVSFVAGWAQMLVYVVTVAVSAFFVPHYLSIFWEPLNENPWDIVGGAVVIVVLVTLNVQARGVKILGRDELAPDAPEVLREDDSRGIVDLMLAKAIQMAVQQHEHLVVELKRPSVRVGAEEISQIQRYATAVARDERFAKTNTNWNFWVISNELDQHAEQMARQTDRPQGVVYQGPGIRVWVKTWAQLIDDCEQRLKFVKTNLEIQSTRDEAVDYLHRTYERFLPRTISSAPGVEGAAVGSQA
jgi:hypothetical protein